MCADWIQQRSITTSKNASGSELHSGVNVAPASDAVAGVWQTLKMARDKANSHVAFAGLKELRAIAGPDVREI
jgi:hypothetical protein